MPPDQAAKELAEIHLHARLVQAQELDADRDHGRGQQEIAHGMLRQVAVEVSERNGNRGKVNGLAHQLVTERHPHSHSIVAGGFVDTSYTTRFTPGTSLAMRLAARVRSEAGKRAQSAVMPSSLVTARRATTRS